MVNVKYIGRTTDFCGKTLWEIVGNLKNYGVGRLVHRQMYLRYPEPCYFKILKVIPIQYDGNTSNPHENFRRVVVYVENVFRGYRDPQVYELFRTTYKPDFRLIPKHEEHDWIRRTEEIEKKIEYIDPYVDMPPLLKKVVIRELKAKNEEVTPDKLKLKYSFKENTTNMTRVADENHPATRKIESFFGTPLTPQLYNVSEEVKKYFQEKRPF